MSAYFFDSSAIVKRYVDEPGTAWVTSVIDPEAGHDIYICRIAGAEVISAIARRGHRGRFRVQYSDSDKATRTNLGNEIAEGLRWLLKHRLLRTLGIQGGIMNLVGAGMDSIMVLYALEILGLNEVGYGLLWACGTEFIISQNSAKV